MQIQVTPERSCVPASQGTTLPVLVQLTAPTIPQAARKPLNLCLVIDRSGSMAGEKLRQTIASAKFVVERLAGTDLLSVVQFDERVKVVIPLGPVTDKAELCRRLDRIRDGGQTNLSGGWLRGAACVREHVSPATINRVLLLTDGQANHGITDPAALVKHAAELTEEGITSTTLGYGADFHEELLTALADAGRGNAYHVETADQAPAIFAQELEGLLAVAVQNVQLLVQPLCPVQAVRLLHDYQHTTCGNALEVSLGDLYSAEPRGLLFELDLGPASPTAVLPLATIHVAYDAVGGAITHREVTLDLRVEVASAAVAAQAATDPGVAREALLLRAARTLTRALALADRGDLLAACRLLETFLAEPEGGPVVADPEILAARERIAALLRQLLDEGYGSLSRKRMLYSSREWSGRQRKAPGA